MIAKNTRKIRHADFHSLGRNKAGESVDGKLNFRHAARLATETPDVPPVAASFSFWNATRNCGMTTQPNGEPEPGLDLLAFAKLLKERHSRPLTPDVAELEPPALAKLLEERLARQLPDPKREFELPALAKLLTEGQERPASEIVAELDKPTPTALSQFQWEALSSAQRDVGIGLVNAERTPPDPSVSVAAKPPRAGNQNDWLHDAGSEPPQEFYCDKWLTSTQTKIGFAIRHVNLKPVKTERALRDYLKNAASAKSPRVWCRATLTADIDIFFRDPKSLHDAEARLKEYPQRKPKEVGGSPRKPVL